MDEGEPRLADNDALFREHRLAQFECANCGYGASRAVAPERCPMCSATVWEFRPRQPFAGNMLEADS
jgi:rubrerythrin